MRTLRFILQKEFRQIFRNKSLLPMIFAMPIIQLLIMPLAANYEVKHINIAVVDHDHSVAATSLRNKITASGYFNLAGYGESYQTAFTQIERDKADLILEIPQGFERNLIREKKQELLVAVNAINGTKALLGGAYLSTIIRNFNGQLNAEWASANTQILNPQIEVVSSNWFNPFLNYAFFMVPGILVVLVTMVGAYMCALNIVKEKELGTIEQINVSPIKKFHFILGKMIPFWVIGMGLFTVGLLGIGRFVYGIVPVGNIGIIYAFLSIYLVALLGLGLLISTYSETQQQAMSVAFFFMMVFLLMSGLFTSIDSIPGWAKIIAWLNPVTYFIEVMRMVILKGSGMKELRVHFLAIIGFAIVFNSWAILNYRKSS
ncbi:MAG: ABC transporter permease [Chitinophagaceae bacterium]